MTTPPVIYQVSLDIDADIAGAFAAWLGPHIREILHLDGFVGAEWFEVETEVAGRVRWCVQYRVASREALQTYFDVHAARLRGDGLDRFGGQFETSRRILTLRETQG